MAKLVSSQRTNTALSHSTPTDERNDLPARSASPILRLVGVGLILLLVLASLWLTTVLFQTDPTESRTIPSSPIQSQ